MESEQISAAAIFEAQIKSVWSVGRWGGYGTAEQRNKSHLNRKGKRRGKGELPAARRGVIWRQLCAT